MSPPLTLNPKIMVHKENDLQKLLDKESKKNDWTPSQLPRAGEVVDVRSEPATITSQIQQNH